MNLKANKAFLILVLAGVIVLTGTSCRKKTDSDIPEEPAERVQAATAS